MRGIIAFSKWCDCLPITKQASMLAGAGFDGVDMPCRPGSATTLDNAIIRLPEAIRIFSDHGLSIRRLVCDLVTGDDHAIESFLACLARFDLRLIRLGGFPLTPGTDAISAFDAARRRLAHLERLFEKHGIRAAIQNHSGDCLESNVSAILRLLQDCDPRYIGIQYDPGHCALAGELPHIAIGLMGAYLDSVNIKSPRVEYAFDTSTGQLKHVPVWVPLFDGMLDVARVLRELASVGYDGSLCVHSEYRSHFFRIEHHPEDILELVTNDVAYLRQCMSPNHALP